MKIALYIEDGLEQIVLTPQTETERAILAKVDERSMEVKHGGFYECNGGWMRHSPLDFSSTDTSNRSTILVLRKPLPPPRKPEE